MKAVINFYKGLDPLNTIIFWGIIIVLLLLLVFSILMISKYKKNKQHKLSQEKDELYSDEIALPSNSSDTLIMKDENLLIQNEQKEIFEPFVVNQTEDNNNTIEIEKKFNAEEHVMEYDNELFKLSNVKKNSEIIPEEPQVIKENSSFSMPTKPYERNVLREMSLSQTSPIGIVKRTETTNKPVMKPSEEVNSQTININKSLATSSNQIEKTIIKHQDTTIIANENIKNKSQESIKTNLSSTKQSSEPINSNSSEKISSPLYSSKFQQEPSNEKIMIKNENQSELIPKTVQHATTPVTPASTSVATIPHKQENARFLEEVSQKLAEAEIPDEIDRTAYELQQEEDAIISYKELMQKKDTIKTVDEEDAVISIKELTQRKNNEEKLYNLTENEANNEFIDELKKFRNDLQ